nr:MAG: hypothetical protein 2 [Guangxi cystovirus 9]QYF49818.1 MAG: hypothetical protein 2 [Guangxi cystovirus 21]
MIVKEQSIHQLAAGAARAVDTAHVVDSTGRMYAIGGLCAGLKTSVLLVDLATQTCIGRCESAGVRKGCHQIVITFDRAIFKAFVSKFAQPNSPVVFYDSGVATRYRVEASDGV